MWEKERDFCVPLFSRAFFPHFYFVNLCPLKKKMGSFGILRRASQSQRSNTKQLPSLFFSLLFSRSISQLSSQSQWSFSQRSFFCCNCLFYLFRHSCMPNALVLRLWTAGLLLVSRSISMASFCAKTRRLEAPPRLWEGYMMTLVLSFNLCVCGCTYICTTFSLLGFGYLLDFTFWWLIISLCPGIIFISRKLVVLSLNFCFLV